MFAKLGFLLAVVCFGALMFVAGTLAPENVRAPVATFGRAVVAKLPGQGEAPKAATEEAKAGAAQEPPPIASESLQLPVPLPAKGEYALQAGQFAVPEPAEELGKRLQKADVPFEILPVVDKDGQKWSLVAAGKYATPEEARTARMGLAERLGITGGLPVILMPVKGS